MKKSQGEQIYQINSQQIFFNSGNDFNSGKKFNNSNQFSQNFMNLNNNFSRNAEVPNGRVNNYGIEGENSINIIESNLSKGSSRSYSKLEQRMRNKYRNNITANTPNFDNRFVNTAREANMGGTVRNPVQQDKKYNTFNYNNMGNTNNINFSDPYELQQFRNGKTVNNKAGPQSKILIQKTLLKPKFGFKAKRAQENQDRTTNTEDDLISFQNSTINKTKRINQSGMSLNGSKSASNFADVLKMEDSNLNIKVIKNGDLQGYIINKVDKKEEKLAKKLQQIKKENQIYDKKIKEKERQIQHAMKKIQTQQKQYSNYQSRMQAYDNIAQNQDSLLISSRNYETANPRMQERVSKKTTIRCCFEGMPRKICKEIIYGTCLIFQNHLFSLGFENKTKPGLIQLYFIVKQNLLEMQIILENLVQNGFKINEENNHIKINNIPAQKKIKIKLNVDYVGILNQKMGLINLKIVTKINQNSIFAHEMPLPFTLYRNFIFQKQLQSRDRIAIKQKYMQFRQKNMYFYPIVTQWENSCDELIKNPKGYLQTLFNKKTGEWVQQGVYNIQLLSINGQTKAINILINCQNFAIQMKDTKNLDIVLAIGNFLAKCKDPKASKLTRYS